MVKIAHIINPVKVKESSDLYNAQPITFESMVVASKYAVKFNQITLYSTQFEEDKEIIPSDFKILSNLTKSILDINPKYKGKKLPFIKDIFEKLNEVEDADYFIYTNVDIALMPYFYDVVIDYIKVGHDAIIINRRRLSKHYSSPNELQFMYADLGKSHPGFDCFIFKKELLNKFVLGNICVGIPFLEATLVHNLMAFANNPLFVPDKHLTFHIGMEVMPKIHKPYYLHNRVDFFKNIYPKLKPFFTLQKFPYAALPMYKRAIKWMLNPSIFTLNYIDLERKNIFEKTKTVLNEIRWRILQR